MLATTGAEDNRDFIRELQGIPALIQAIEIHEHDDTVLRFCFVALGLVCCHNRACCSRCASCILVEHLLLHAGWVTGPDTVARCMHACVTFTSATGKNQDLICSLGGIDLAFKVGASFADNPHVLDSICQMFFNISENNGTLESDGSLCTVAVAEQPLPSS